MAMQRCSDCGATAKVGEEFRHTPHCRYNSDPKPLRLRELARGLGDTLARKSDAYGDSAGKVGEFLALLWPEGIAPAQYEDAMLLARIFDKAMRVATRKQAFGESPFLDIAGYGVIGMEKDARREAEELLAEIREKEARR